MGPQLFELVLFAGITLFLINKLVGILGATDEESVKAPYGNIKDVTSTTTTSYSDIIEAEDKDEVESYLIRISELLPNFDVRKFLHGAKGAFKMALKALIENDQNTIDALVDKRFIEKFQALRQKYVSLNDISNLDANLMEAKITYAYIFGNNLSIKVLFKPNANTNEEWTFLKSLLSSGKEWHISNVE